MFGFRAALRRPVRLSHLITFFLSGAVCWNRDNSVLRVRSIIYSEVLRDCRWAFGVAASPPFGKIQMWRQAQRRSWWATRD